MFANALAQVEPPQIGVHLIWSGPHSWVYSPSGWSIQRRLFSGRGRLDCHRLDEAALFQLRSDLELRIRSGIVTLSRCSWPEPLNSAQPTPRPDPALVLPPACELFRLELDVTQPAVAVRVTAKESFVVALRGGKAVAAQGPLTGSVSYDLLALGIDTVAVYTQAATTISFCTHVHEQDEEQEWANVPFVVQNLQLPLEELLPMLGTPAAEFSEAKSRLLPGETLSEEEFKRLLSSLRPAVRAAGPPRPIDQVLLIREESTEDFEEASALDPIRVLLSHPKWRRVLGFGFFDRDPTLVPGQTYEYRLTGFFPGADLVDEVFGFHTIPSHILLPADFFMGSLRVRLPQPVQVKLDPGTPATGKVQVSRRGIPLRPLNEPFWLLPSLEDWSLVVDFPAPVTSVLLELHPQHDLKFSVGDPGNFVGPVLPVPSGSRPRLNFSVPIQQLRLAGEGFLFALRVPRGTAELVQTSLVLPPVLLVNTPPPPLPLSVSLRNLQLPQPILDNDTPPETMLPRHALGFQVRWRPAPSADLSAWPPDLDASPPLDAAIFQIEHRQPPSANWQPLLPEENWTLGERNEKPAIRPITPGCDLMELFPEVVRRPPGTGLDLFWRDVFDFAESGEPVLRPVPEPGTLHQYRVRAVDAIGRPSLSWLNTEQLRLEKHVPPPIPVGPHPAPDEEPVPPVPSGVQARVLVRDAPDLTAAERARLGGDDHAVILRWGWRTQQREQDPFTREFRVYTARPLDVVPGTVLSVTTLETGSVAVYEVTVKLERPVAANAARGQNLEAGYPFFIRTQSGGDQIIAVVETRLPKPGGGFQIPELGPVRLPIRMTPRLTHPTSWARRALVVPLTAAESYEAVLRNLLTLSDDNPNDAIWVGVSAADDQFYIPDSLAPLETRQGNESAIVPVLCQARYQGRPIFDIPPALAPVPVFVTPEPAGQPVFFRLDLAPFLAESGLVAGDRVLPERVSAGTLFASLAATPDGRVLGHPVEPLRPGEEDIEITIPNPNDRAAIVAALNGSTTAALEDRYLVFLASAHPYRHRLFVPAAQQPVPFADFTETLPTAASRYVYRVRKSDRAGRLSAGGAVAAVVVWVPSLMPGAAPERLPAEVGDESAQLRLRLPADPELSHLLSFSQPILNGVGPIEAPEVLRVPNRPDLYPHDGIWLRVPGGTLLSPQVSSLSGANVTIDADGSRRVELTFTAAPGDRLRVWACSLTQDGVPSLVGGPWSLVMPLPPLPVPALSVSSEQPLHFTWLPLDPTGPRFQVALERAPSTASDDSPLWQRISPLLSPLTSSFDHTPPPGEWQYRLRAIASDGRSAFGPAVIP